MKKIFLFINNLIFNFNFSLGAVHDQTGNATSCPASNNNIMTASVGAYTNSTKFVSLVCWISLFNYFVFSLFYFSNCSITAFKQTLLTSDYK